MSKFQELPAVRQPEILRQSLFKFYGIFSIGRIVIKMELFYFIFILSANLADYYEFNSFERTNLRIIALNHIKISLFISPLPHILLFFKVLLLLK